MKNKRFFLFILRNTTENRRNSSVAKDGEEFRLIPLTQGQFAIVDVEAYDRLAPHKWCAGEFAYLKFPERIELRNWMQKIIKIIWTA